MSQHPQSTGSANQEDESEPQQVRLNKFLASAGLGSRRSCEEFITQGRVTVAGKTVRDLSCTVEADSRVVKVDGELVKPKRKRYYLLNKPAGCLCTNHDPQGRPRAIDLVPQGENDLFTVGRLDESSQGLLIVTNDGELANQLAHPRYEISRTYRVQVAGIPTSETLNQLRKGIYFPDGKLQFDSIRKTKAQGQSVFLEVTLHQGRNREIRRLLARVDHKVMFLERIAFGPLTLGKLKTGSHRTLTREEIAELRKLVKPTRKDRRRPNSQSSSRPRQQNSRSQSRSNNRSKSRSKRGNSRGRNR